MSDTYEIYAVKYAHHGPRSAALNFIGGDPHETSHDLDFYVWAVFNKDRTIVVDTGFDAAMAKKRDRTILKPVAGALAAAVFTGFVAGAAIGGEFSAPIALGAGVGYLGIARLWWNRIAAANQRRLRAVADEVAALLERG